MCIFGGGIRHKNVVKRLPAYMKKDTYLGQ